jgi:hypothetical protein
MNFRHSKAGPAAAVGSSVLAKVRLFLQEARR